MFKPNERQILKIKCALRTKNIVHLWLPLPLRPRYLVGSSIEICKHDIALKTSYISNAQYGLTHIG